MSGPSDPMEGAPKPKELLQVECFKIEAVRHENFKKAKGERLQEKKATVKDMVKGVEYYFPHSIDFKDVESGIESKEEWLYLCKCIFVQGDIRRVQYADGSIHRLAA